MSKVIEINVQTGEKVTRDLTDKEKQFVIDSIPTASDKLIVLREERNMLLKETDWMSASDLTMADNWKIYRQELRDITKTYQSMDADGFVFPTKPTE